MKTSIPIPGDRIIALKCTKGDVAYSFGVGIYDGDFYVEDGLKNPRMTLDNGDVIWGYECWWDHEENILERISSLEVRQVTIAEYRAASAISKEWDFAKVGDRVILYYMIDDINKIIYSFGSGVYERDDVEIIDGDKFRMPKFKMDNDIDVTNIYNPSFDREDYFQEELAEYKIELIDPKNLSPNQYLK